MTTPEKMQLYAEIPCALYAELEVLAKEQNKTPNEIYEEAFVFYMNTQKPKHAVMQHYMASVKQYDQLYQRLAE
jgi:predicted ATP-grasp superfamily ATP-dependent carboligase